MNLGTPVIRAVSQATICERLSFDARWLGCKNGGWVLVDASEPQRMGPLLPLFNASAARKVCLDHHLKAAKEAPQGFDQEFTDPTASASANHRPLPSRR